ncbi:hypothetical protein OHU45_02995 [Streptomyces tubercidicus]|uniref:RraA family protein n=1 Tax=Streptomyces tubercidicus TaxID=47759 RepID=UPI0030E54287
MRGRCYALRLRGEIRTATTRTRGAVIGGFHPDTPTGPVFSRGRYAQDSAVRTRIIDHGVPTEIGGAQVDPGDLDFGDLDGVVVIPWEIEDEVIERAIDNDSAENLVLRAIEGGYEHRGVFRLRRAVTGRP